MFEDRVRRSDGRCQVAKSGRATTLDVGIFCRCRNIRCAEEGTPHLLCHVIKHGRVGTTAGLMSVAVRQNAKCPRTHTPHPTNKFVEFQLRWCLNIASPGSQPKTETFREQAP